MLPLLLLPILAAQIQALHFKEFTMTATSDFPRSWFGYDPVFDEAERLCKSSCRKDSDCDLAFRSLEKEFCDSLSPYSSMSWLPHGKESR